MSRALSSAHTVIEALRNRDEISITVTGRRSGRAITLPVWFALERKTLWLLPVRGSQTQWYRNLRARPAITIRAGRQRVTTTGHPTRNRVIVRAVVAKFRRKYTLEEIARYYSTFDAAVRVTLV